jgi:23S rRNA (uracil1939-C5)-methyltransferase
MPRGPVKLAPDERLLVQSLDLEGQGVARRAEGKVVFIDGALPAETVTAHVVRAKNQWEQAALVNVLRASALRVAPACAHFGLHTGACGGCKMQHLHASAQVAVKQRALEDQLWHLAKVKAGHILRPIEGPAWGYRHRARLSVRYVRKKDSVLVGFHERKSSYVAELHACAVLPPQVSDMLDPLRELVGSLEARERCPQLELACSDGCIALVLRHLQPLAAADVQRLRDFAAVHPPLQWWLQPQGPDSAHPLDADASELAYSLPEFGLRMPFRPTDFTQVNPAVNQVLVTRALRLLAVQPTERVIDWFCGLGNFTLPLATQARAVLGVEGSAALVARARANLEVNQAAGQTRRAWAATEFVARDLFTMTPERLRADGTAHKWLLDPPREGALALVQALSESCQSPKPGWQPPQRIVYVSCNPAILARDAGILVHQAGYICKAAGVINMFPHTAHVESMALFEREVAAA